VGGVSDGGLASPDFDELFDVHLLQVPVDVWARTQEHTDELLREFALIAAGPESAGAVPARLTALLEQLNQIYGGVGSDQESQLFAAAEAGEQVIEDLAFSVPAAAAQAADVLGGLLDEADAFCLAGEHLLTLATPPELVRFRQWYLEQFVVQIGGVAPVAWPDYAPA
jgi:hypothetical protein